MDVQPNTTTTPHLTVEAVADQLGVTEKTIYRYVKSGRLRAVRLGSRLLRIDPASVAELLQPADQSDDIDPTVQALVDRAPDLSAEQLRALAELLRPVRVTA